LCLARDGYSTSLWQSIHPHPTIRCKAKTNGIASSLINFHSMRVGAIPTISKVKDLKKGVSVNSRNMILAKKTMKNFYTYGS
jgi:hypothetical protein